MEQREREESEHSSVHRNTNIGVISPQSFRYFEPAYKQFADEYKQKYYNAHPEMYQQPEEGTTGYMTVIPIAPGTQLDISSPDYPRVYGSEVSQDVLAMSPRPIIIIRN